ncbi:hypothetical protein K474DRAFT_1711009 [Panus rudis PR-1116 ss-1]|nr:hypothetical protein K474DRAFT_1711009 [Panus rudis PR-1116 ss-1]
MQGHDSSDYLGSDEDDSKNKWWRRKRSDSPASKGIPSPPEGDEPKINLKRRRSDRLSSNTKGREKIQKLLEDGGYFNTQTSDTQYFGWNKPAKDSEPEQINRRKFKRCQISKIHRKISRTHLTLARYHEELADAYDTSTSDSDSRDDDPANVSVEDTEQASTEVAGAKVMQLPLAGTNNFDVVCQTGPELAAATISDVDYNSEVLSNSGSAVEPISEVTSDTEFEVYKIKHAITGDTVLLSAKQQSQEVVFTFTETCPYIPDDVEWPGGDGGPGYDPTKSVTQSESIPQTEKGEPGTSTVPKQGLVPGSPIPRSRLLWNPRSQTLRRVVETFGKEETEGEAEGIAAGTQR